MRVTTTIEKPRSDNVITNLLLRTIHHAAEENLLRFPLNLSVSRIQLRLPINDEERFTAYLSADRAAATAAVRGGTFVIIECPERQLGSVAMRTMSLEEIESRLYRHPRR